MKGLLNFAAMSSIGIMAVFGILNSRKVAGAEKLRKEVEEDMNKSFVDSSKAVSDSVEDNIRHITTHILKEGGVSERSDFLRAFAKELLQVKFNQPVNIVDILPKDVEGMEEIIKRFGLYEEYEKQLKKNHEIIYGKEVQVIRSEVRKRKVRSSGKVVTIRSLELIGV